MKACDEAASALLKRIDALDAKLASSRDQRKDLGELERLLRPGDLVLFKASRGMALDRAAAEAVRQWHFEPARRGAEAVAMWVLVPGEFRLQ